MAENEIGHVGGNALKLAGEVFVPGASELMAGHVTSGFAHAALGLAAGVALIGTGIAPVIGTLAVLGIKLNSYSRAVTGKDVFQQGKEMMPKIADRSDAPGA